MGEAYYKLAMDYKQILAQFQVIENWRQGIM
jgi:hypothetical protein